MVGDIFGWLIWSLVDLEVGFFILGGGNSNMFLMFNLEKNGEMIPIFTDIFQLG